MATKKQAKTATHNTQPERIRVTLTVEAENEKDLNDALDSAMRLGREQYIGISYGSKNLHGPRVSCRTTRISHKNCGEKK